MRSVSSREWMFLAVILIYSFVPTFRGLFRIAELLGGAAIIPANSRALELVQFKPMHIRS